MRQKPPSHSRALTGIQVGLFTVILSAVVSPATAQPEPTTEHGKHYYPGRWEWERRDPAQAGFDADKLAAAIEFAKDNETRGVFAMTNEPHGEIIGPTKPGEGQSGMFVRDGYIVAEWGDVHRVDMTYSVTKTYLSTVAGLAVDRGLIRDVQDPVRLYVQDLGFETEHNHQITWHQLLNQTSGWQGTLFGKPDWSDRFRGTRREPEEPGKHWRYNDVRVNALALALLNVWRRPLPQVLKESIMDPIDASPTWRWHGYENSWIGIDGVKMQSVAGGGHWGGGMFISTRDHARFGYLMLRNGNWKGRQLISRDWIKRATTPTGLQPTYGYMNWFLNKHPEKKRFRAAPDGSVFFLGAGTNMIWLDPDHEMVVVVRWIRTNRVNAFIERVLGALNDDERRSQ